MRRPRPPPPPFAFSFIHKPHPGPLHEYINYTPYAPCLPPVRSSGSLLNRTRVVRRLGNTPGEMGEGHGGIPDPSDVDPNLIMVPAGRHQPTGGDGVKLKKSGNQGSKTSKARLRLVPAAWV